MHPNGQLPAYEWNFNDVNPPVYAWATWKVYEMEKDKKNGKGDLAFLESVFHKLLLNFSWWVNRKDANGTYIFEGGFLGLDNIKDVFGKDYEILATATRMPTQSKAPYDRKFPLLLRLDRPAQGNVLCLGTKSLNINSTIMLFQYPNGKFILKMTMGKVLAIETRNFHYDANTVPGAGGAPVINMNGEVVEIAGSTRYGTGYADGEFNAALFTQGNGNDVVIDTAGNIYKAESANGVVRKIILH